MGTPSVLVKVKLTKMKNMFSMFSIPLIQMECVNWVVKKQQLLNLPKNLTKIDSIETDFHAYKDNSNFNFSILRCLNRYQKRNRTKLFRKSNSVTSHRCN